MTFTRNQIAKRQAAITKRLTEIYEYGRRLSHSTREPVQLDVNLQEFQNRVKREAVESESLRKELEELSTQWLESRDEDEPDQETYIPSALSAPIPLLVLLHGAGWTGGSQIELWEPIARREGLALLAPTSLNGEWTHRADYQALATKFHDALRTMSIDRSRIYLIGHSRGGAQALRMGLVNCNQIAGMALHSPSSDQPILRERFVHSERKLPIRIWAGLDYERDSNRHWAEILQMHFRQHPELANVEVGLTLLDGRNHRDYNTREGLLDDMWSFLRDKLLTEP